MAEDVLEVVDQDLSPVCLQLIGQGTDEGGASRARLGRQVGQEHLEGPLRIQVCIKCIYSETHTCTYRIQSQCNITSNTLYMCTFVSEHAFVSLCR